MKVIGQTESGLLISATDKEIANLCGFYWRGDQGCPDIKVGMEIKVSEMYLHLYELARRKEALSKHASELRVIADLLETKNPIVNEVAMTSAAGRSDVR